MAVAPTIAPTVLTPPLRSCWLTRATTGRDTRPLRAARTLADQGHEEKSDRSSNSQPRGHRDAHTRAARKAASVSSGVGVALTGMLLRLVRLRLCTCKSRQRDARPRDGASAASVAEAHYTGSGAL